MWKLKIIVLYANWSLLQIDNSENDYIIII